jgi:Septum formation initiator
MAPASATASRRAPVRRSNIQWHRVGRVALLGTLLVILVLYISPIANWFQQRSTAANSTAELHGLQREHDRLESRLRSLDSVGAVEQRAREMGMVRRGERAYVIEGR